MKTLFALITAIVVITMMVVGCSTGQKAQFVGMWTGLDRPDGYFPPPIQTEFFADGTLTQRSLAPTSSGSLLPGTYHVSLEGKTTYLKMDCHGGMVSKMYEVVSVTDGQIELKDGARSMHLRRVSKTYPS